MKISPTENKTPSKHLSAYLIRHTRRRLTAAPERYERTGELGGRARPADADIALPFPNGSTRVYGAGLTAEGTCQVFGNPYLLPSQAWGVEEQKAALEDIAHAGEHHDYLEGL